MKVVEVGAKHVIRMIKTANEKVKEESRISKMQFANLVTAYTGAIAKANKQWVDSIGDTYHKIAQNDN
jgi:hypothetical protein